MITSVLKISDTEIPPSVWLEAELNARISKDGGALNFWFSYWPQKSLGQLTEVDLAPGLKVYCKLIDGTEVPENIEIKTAAFDDQQLTLETLTSIFADDGAGKAILKLAKRSKPYGLIQFDPARWFGPANLQKNCQRYFTELAGRKFPEPTLADFRGFAVYLKSREQSIKLRTLQSSKALREERLAWSTRCRQAFENAYALKP